MTPVTCPSCKKPMEIDVNEPNTEWECPTCGAAFLIRPNSAGTLEYMITQSATSIAAEEHLPAATTPGVTSSRDPAISDDAYLFALEQLLKGTKPREVRKSLVESGHTAQQANTIVQTALQFKKDDEARERAMPDSGGNSGMRNMAIGGIICVVGIVITIGTFSAATQAGGGTYTIAWGAIVFGFIQFMRGLMQTNQR